MSDPLLSLLRTVDCELRRQREPRGPTAVEVRAEMKQRGLRHCFYPGYGFMWRRGRRVPDEREMEQIGRIVAMHEQGRSLYQVAVTFLWERVKTRSGKEWSYDRVRRAHRVAVRGEVPGVTIQSNRRASADRIGVSESSNIRSSATSCQQPDNSDCHG